jgi:uncharacterized membrane protein
MAETYDANANPAPNPYRAPEEGGGDTGKVVERDVSSSVTIMHVIYALHALAPFTFWTLAIVAWLIGLVTRDDVRGTWLESHHTWTTRTFWWGLLWAALAWGTFWVLGLLTLGIGMFVLWILPAAVLIWYLYRVVRGWLRLNDRQPVDLGY